MRKLIAIAFLPLLLLTLSFPAASLPAEIYDVGVRRVVTIGEYGAVVSNDTFRVINNGTSPISSIEYAMPRSFAANLRYVIAKDSSGRILDLQRDVDASSSYFWVRVNLRDKLAPKERIDFFVSSAYSNVLTFVKATTGTEEKYAASIPVYAILKTPARYNNVTIHAIGDAKFEVRADSGFVMAQIGGTPALAGQMVPLPAMTDKQLSFNFTSNNQRLVRCDWAKREIEVTPQGNLKVSDSYQLTNLARPFYSIKTGVPIDANDVTSYDDLGILSKIPSASGQADVTPRFSAVRQDESMTFTLKYQLTSGRVRQLQWWGLYNLTFNLLSNPLWPVDNAQVTLRTPQGLRVDSISPKPTRTNAGFYESTSVFELNDVTPLNDLQLSMTYRYTPFWAAFTPMIWLGMVIGTVAVTKLFLRKRKQPEMASAVPVDLIRRFVDLNDERTALRLELDKISQELARSAISRPEHRRRSNQIESRGDAIRRELRPVESALSGTSARYGEMIRRIERAEAEIDSARSSETQLRSQYRSGRISRSVFDEMSTQVRRRRDRALETINSTVVILREEAG
ncbi:MAG: hypothetical protein V1857_00005 [archaeon]